MRSRLSIQKGTHLNGLSAPEKIKGRLKCGKVEIFELRIPEEILTANPKGTHAIVSWTLGEML
jgi:hypothetical protein